MTLGLRDRATYQAFRASGRKFAQSTTAGGTNSPGASRRPRARRSSWWRVGERRRRLRGEQHEDLFVRAGELLSAFLVAERTILSNRHGSNRASQRAGAYRTEARARVPGRQGSSGKCNTASQRW